MSMRRTAPFTIKVKPYHQKDGIFFSFYRFPEKKGMYISALFRAKNDQSIIFEE